MEMPLNAFLDFITEGYKMDRNALFVYLHDLRDLEVVKYQIEKKLRRHISLKNTIVQNLQNQIEKEKKENYWQRPEQPEKTLDRKSVV